MKRISVLVVLVLTASQLGAQRTKRPAASGVMSRAARVIDSVGTATSGRVGVAAMIVETGDLVMLHGNERFPMQSVYKVPIAMAVLQQVDAGKLQLSRVIHVRKQDMVPNVGSPMRDRTPNGTDASVRELLRGMIVESDGTASDMLLTLVPPAEVTGMLKNLGIDSMRVMTTERAMAAKSMAQYQNWSTPRAAVQLLRLLQQGHLISAPSRALLLSWMTETTIGLKRIRGELPPGTLVAHKTGTDGTHNGLTRATNDIGIVTLPGGRHLAIAVFLRDSRGTAAQREGAIAKIARVAWDAATARARRK
jgi:beta-lactamase class A